jgi:hypothetical protein
MVEPHDRAVCQEKLIKRSEAMVRDSDQSANDRIGTANPPHT